MISNQVRIYSRFVINKNRVINFHNSHQHLPGMMYSNSIVTPNKITWKIISTSVHLDADVHKKNVITPIAGIVRRCSVTTQVCINSYDALPLSHGLIESLITILQIGQKKTARRDVSHDSSSYLKLLIASATSCTLPRARNLCTIIYKNLPNNTKKFHYINHSLEY